MPAILTACECTRLADLELQYTSVSNGWQDFRRNDTVGLEMCATITATSTQPETDSRTSLELFRMKKRSHQRESTGEVADQGDESRRRWLLRHWVPGV